jgi:Pex19 protein family
MYSTQYSYVTKIMNKFEDPKYNDEDTKAKAELVDLMQKVS